MSELDTYLIFDGNCAEAMRFYERALGGTLEMLMTHAESPMAAQTPKGSEDRIMHARLVVGGRALMASDDQVGANYKGMHGFSVSVTYPTAGEAKKVYDALAPGGKITQPLQKMFWAEAFGMLVDRFGTPWIINGAPAPRA